MAGLSPTLPVNSVNTNVASTSSSSSTSSANSITGQLGPEAFLQLLTTQLANQDPLNPMDDTQSVTQLAQFSALQSQDNLATSFANFQANFSVIQSASLIGKTVQVTTSDSTSSGSSSVTGTVQAIQVVSGTPSFTMTDSSGNVITGTNGQPETFTTSQITGIGN